VHCHRASIPPRQNRLRSRIGRKQHRRPRLAATQIAVESAFAAGRTRADDRDLDKSIRARAGVWIENVMEAPAWLERRAIAPDTASAMSASSMRAAAIARRLAVLRMPSRQGRPSGWRPSVRNSPRSNHRALEAFVAQEVGDDVSNVALCQAVERDRHAGARESRSMLRRPRCGGNQRTRSRPHARRAAMSACTSECDQKMRLIEPPQRLYRDVKGTAAQRRYALAFVN